MSYEIELYQQDPVLRSQRWMRLSTEELRRKVVRASIDADRHTLWDLTVAHMIAFGEAGALISENTLRSYRTSVNQFLDHTDTQAVSLLNPHHEVGRTWVRGLEAVGKSAATVRVRMAGARAMFKALRWAGATQTDPFLDVKPARDTTPAWEKRFPYQHEEVETLIGAAPTRFRKLILLCAHGGLRISEALNVKIGDISLSERVLVVRKGKGRKTRRVVLSQTLRDAFEQLTEIPEHKPDDQVVGLSYQGALKTLRALCETTGTVYRAFHSMRHYAGTRIVRETGDIEKVARHLGHADIATARIYAKWSENALHDTVGNW